MHAFSFWMLLALSWSFHVQPGNSEVPEEAQAAALKQSPGHVYETSFCRRRLKKVHVGLWAVSRRQAYTHAYTHTFLQSGQELACARFRSFSFFFLNAQSKRFFQERQNPASPL